jgi:alpha-mannosidase
MEIPRAIALERLELLETGKCYRVPVSLPKNLYSAYHEVDALYITNEPTGRIPFCEATALPLRPLKTGESWGPLWVTYWVKVELTRPEGDEVHLIWDSSSEAMLYDAEGIALQLFNGSGGDDRRVRFILPYPGAYTYWVEVACNEAFGGGGIHPPDPNKHFSFKECRMGVFRRQAYELLWDFRTLQDCATELKDRTSGDVALRIANKIADVVDAQDPSTYAAGRALAASYLSQRRGDDYEVVHAIGHCHIDTAWLWPYAETRRKCVRSWATQVELMKQYPLHKFCASAALHYQWVKEDNPEVYQRILQRYTEGRWEFLGAAWVEFDANLPSGESMARQFLHGQRFFKANFGARSPIFFLPDTFGYSAQLPQLCRKAGVKYFVSQKLSWNLINKFPYSTFNWRGLDGSQVLTHFPPADTYNSHGRLTHVLKSISNNKQKAVNAKSLLLFGHGDGGGGPDDYMLEALHRLQDLRDVPKVKFGSVEGFFEELEGSEYPTWQGELYFELHRGTFTTMAALKKYNRQLEQRLARLEVESVCFGFEVPELESMWKRLLQHQFHDVIPGTCIELVYEDVLPDCLKLLQEIDAIEQSHPETAAFNTLSFDVDVLVDGQPHRIKALSTLSERLDLPHVRVEVRETEVFLANQFLEARVSLDGSLLSLVHEGRELLKQPGNLMALYDDTPFFWEAWDVEIYHMSSRKLTTGQPTLKLIEQSPFEVSLQWTREVSAKLRIVQVIRLRAVDKWLEFDTQVDWTETNKILKVEFPTDLVLTARASFEIQFGHLERPTHWNTTWDQAKFEVMGHKWMDLSEGDFGLAVLNDCKYGMNIHEGLMALTLLRSPKAPNEHSDMGSHTFKYALMPHAGTLVQAAVPQQALLFNNYRAFSTSKAPVSFVSISNPRVILSALKRAEDSEDLVLRVYESSGTKTSAVVTFSAEKFGRLRQVYLSNLLEDDEELVETQDNSFEVTLTAFEVSTYKLSFT